jgi:hypothetical protein
MGKYENLDRLQRDADDLVGAAYGAFSLAGWFFWWLLLYCAQMGLVIWIFDDVHAVLAWIFLVTAGIGASIINSWISR